jgi:hypothetical protein
MRKKKKNADKIIKKIIFLFNESRYENFDAGIAIF